VKDGKLKSTKDKLSKKCSDWNKKYMSGAAKEALVKSVAQAISTYAMSVSKFSCGLCDELSQISGIFGGEMKMKEERFTGCCGTK
jgi:hypothetical protein